MDDITWDEAMGTVDEYARRIAFTDEDAQRNTISVALALAVLYADDRWVSDMDKRHPVKRKFERGRPVDPKSRARFGMWVRETINGLSPIHTTRLLQAADLTVNYLSSGSKKPVAEGTVRPLKPLVREGREDDIPKVWQSAVDAAAAEGHDRPTETHVKTAIREYRATLPKATAGRAKSSPGDLRVSRATADLTWLFGNGFRDVVADIVGKFHRCPGSTP